MKKVQIIKNNEENVKNELKNLEFLNSVNMQKTLLFFKGFIKGIIKYSIPFILCTMGFYKFVNLGYITDVVSNNLNVASSIFSSMLLGTMCGLTCEFLVTVLEKKDFYTREQLASIILEQLDYSLIKTLSKRKQKAVKKCLAIFFEKKAAMLSCMTNYNKPTNAAIIEEMGTTREYFEEKQKIIRQFGQKINDTPVICISAEDAIGYQVLIDEVPMRLGRKLPEIDIENFELVTASEVVDNIDDEIADAEKIIDTDELTQVKKAYLINRLSCLLKYQAKSLQAKELSNLACDEVEDLERQKQEFSTGHSKEPQYTLYIKDKKN